MKTVSVRIAGRPGSEVVMNGYESDRLTSALARAAIRIAAGGGTFGTVSDGERAYRVTTVTRRVQEE